MESPTTPPKVIGVRMTVVVVTMASVSPTALPAPRPVSVTLGGVGTPVTLLQVIYCDTISGWLLISEQSIILGNFPIFLLSHYLN